MYTYVSFTGLLFVENFDLFLFSLIDRGETIIHFSSL